MNAILLPDKHVVLATCRRLPVFVDHEVLDCVGELSELHIWHCQRSWIGRIDQDRAQLVKEIDRWVSRNSPLPQPGALLHTETFGAVLDRLARLCAVAYFPGVVSEKVTYQIELLSARLADDYQELNVEVSQGSRRLPELTDPVPPSAGAGIRLAIRTVSCQGPRRRAF
ncbi:DUF4254 domain-containing protein [Nocardia gipuzkoensis]|uniref:DUF4254 domain-containing protein n=1 Tax=Nocardia gipuzkoensis TaxID=2749991 RepID=UPI00237E8561|nr:DUF4254 domain-containing protein [Nocardia gipuzkoensis]MDE1675271.1 DUF4254 domain-containing protein [Nocardia gipuzkoensis]